eukprot:Sdes_comp17866_c0_seq1m7133
MFQKKPLLSISLLFLSLNPLAWAQLTSLPPAFNSSFLPLVLASNSSSPSSSSVTNSTPIISVLFSFATSYGIGGLLLLLFCLIRTHFPNLYFPRCNRSIRNSPPLPPSTLFGWMYPVWKLSDKDVLREIGIDA